MILAPITPDQIPSTEQERRKRTPVKQENRRDDRLDVFQQQLNIEESVKLNMQTREV